MKKEASHLKERMASRETSVVSLSICCRLVMMGYVATVTVSQRQMREYLVRLVYCEMLGQDCSWGYIHAVKFTQNSNLMDKRIGQGSIYHAYYTNANSTGTCITILLV